jgi:putative transposase
VRYSKVSRSALRYESKRERTDAPVIGAVRQLSAKYPRYGYRRIQVFL